MFQLTPDAAPTVQALNGKNVLPKNMEKTEHKEEAAKKRSIIPAATKVEKR